MFGFFVMRLQMTVILANSVALVQAIFFFLFARGNIGIKLQVYDVNA